MKFCNRLYSSLSFSLLHDYLNNLHVKYLGLLIDVINIYIEVWYSPTWKYVMSQRSERMSVYCIAFALQLYEAQISYPLDSEQCNLRKTSRRAVKLLIWTLQ